MLSAERNIPLNQNLKVLTNKESRVILLPTSKRRIFSWRRSAGLTLLVLGCWITMSLLNQNLFLKEVLASSFIIGCSLLLNKSNVAKSEFK